MIHSAPLPPAPARPRDAARDLALLFGLDSAVRGTLLSVVPLEMYRAWGEGTVVSAFYFATGLASLGCGLMVPWATARLGRGRVTMGAASLHLGAAALYLLGQPWSISAGVLLAAMATVSIWTCLAAYVLDAVPRAGLGRMESLRLFYGAAAWVAGPYGGVLLLHLWRPLPFLVAAGVALAFVAWARRLGLGDGKPVGAAEGPPLAYLGRFLGRPRLVAGWTFATVRSSGWWVYIVYLPLFCLGAGLPETAAGAALSASSLLLFATPLLSRLVQRWGVRRAVRGTFAWTALCFALAWAVAPLSPWATLGALLLASAGLVMLDVCGSLPFLMAVKPSERAEMAAVYTSFRDVSGTLSPLLGGAILLVAPVAAVFAATGAAMAAAWAVAGTVHPRLGRTRGPDA